MSTKKHQIEHQKMYQAGNRWIVKTLLTILLLNLHFILSGSVYILPSLLRGETEGGLEVGGGSLFAQEVSVTVSPVQQVLPPQVAIYIDNPGKYFTIALTNNSAVTQNVYLAMRLEQVVPNSGLQVITPAKRLPQVPYTIPAGGTKQLSLVEMRTMFNHLPKAEVQTTPGLFDDYLNGSFGLLPEGQYRAQLTAYKWDPAISTPQPVSNPASGVCFFTVCYKAQAPQFLTPFATGLDLSTVAEVNAMNAQFTWTQPVITCKPLAGQYTYNFKIVEVDPLQEPDDAIDHNPVLFQLKNLVAPVATLPTSVIKSRFTKKATYAAQVQAVSTNSNANLLDYVMLENEGKSAYRLFKLVTTTPDDPDDPEVPEVPDLPGIDDIDYTAHLELGGKGFGELDSLYIMENVEIRQPDFFEGDVRKRFTKEDMAIEWTRPHYIGGEGENQDGLMFEYTVELFHYDNLDASYYEGEDGTEQLEAILRTKPVFTLTTKELSDTIRWEQIQDKVAKGDYMVLRVTPKCTNETSIRYKGNDNMVDYLLTDRLTRNLFQCAAHTTIESTKPTKKSLDELKNSIIGVGEYALTINTIEKGKEEGCFKGTGHIEWNPMGIKTMVAVKFDTLYINEDNIAYRGLCVTYQDEARKKMSNSECVDSLFSEWGLDHIAEDGDYGFAYWAQQQSTEAANKIAEKVDLAKYYGWVKTGQAASDLFLKGEISDLHLPIQIPKSINKTPVDIQIATMKFAPTYATMDLIGEFVLPDCDYIKNNILVLGAPRLCMSPDRVLPESGHVALLGNFTIDDPKSSYEMTFKAPKNVMQPEDGCFVSWHEDAFEVLRVDIDMKIPNLVKVENDGTVTKKHPILNLTAEVQDWDDWTAKATMDRFQAKDLPGWDFIPGDVMIYDHSTKHNDPDMPALPAGYDRLKAGMSKADAEDNEWMGLYIKKLGAVFPKMIEITDSKKSENGRLKLQADHMMFDGSGCTFNFGLNNIFDAKTGKIGGWGISMDELKLQVRQNQYIKSYFCGNINTPLKGEFSYRCDMYAQGKDAKGLTDPNRRAYVFKTQSKKKLDFSFLLASVNFDPDQTYFLIESEQFPDNPSKDQTKIELSVGGTISIDIAKDGVKAIAKAAGKEKVGKVIATHIPDVHMVGFRIANCKRWESKYTDNLSAIPSSGGKVISTWKEEYTVEDPSSNGDGTGFYLSLGRWSLASLEKHLGPFSFAVEDFKFSYKNAPIGTFSIMGKVGLEGLDNSVFSVDATVDILCRMDVVNNDIGFEDVKFHDLSFNAGFGGMRLGGSLSIGLPTGKPNIPNVGDDEGYCGSLTFHMPGDLFYFDAYGGFFDHKQTDTNYTWGWFDVTIGTEVCEIPPIKITEIKGGFYFNCSPPKADIPSMEMPVDQSKVPTPKLGMYGGKLGLRLATSAGEHLMNAGVVCTLAFDTKAGRMSRLVMQGDMHVLGGSDNSDGVLNSKVTISYVHEEEHYLSIDVTASADLSADKALEAFAGENFKVCDAVASKLEKMVPGERTKSGHTDEPDNGQFRCSAGAEVSVSFKINFDTKKWYFRIGEPNDDPALDRRCKFTFIDFKGGDDFIGFWAYFKAYGYVCFGNELPNGGRLPAIPKDVRAFLDGTDVNGARQNLSSQYNSTQSDFASRMAALFEGESTGGLMFGGGVEGGIGVNAGLVYASGVMSLGFDVVLQHFEKGTGCREQGSDHASGTVGWNGWYGMGQVYAMLKGEIGVQLDLWFWKGRCSLVKAGVGALLQAGLPHPMWVYGKMRAQCSLLGGLYQFNHTIELKAGRICMPDHGNPLDNIELFAEAQPGVKDDYKSGWAQYGAAYLKANKDKANAAPTSPLVTPRFVTNYIMDTEVDLVDENMVEDYMWTHSGVSQTEARRYNCRTYRFKIEALQNGSKYNNYVRLYDGTANKDKRIYVGGSDDNTNYEVNTTLEPNRKYQLILRGIAQEYYSAAHPYYRGSDYGWRDPWIDGRRQAKADEANYYFHTGPLPDNIDGDIGVSRPGLPVSYPTKNYFEKVRKSDVNLPALYLKHHRDDLVGAGEAGNANWDYRWRIRTDKKVLYNCSNVVTRTSEIEYWHPKYLLASKVTGTGPFYLELYRVNKNAGKNTKADTNVEQVINQKKESLTNSGLGSNDAGQAMNQFFEQEGKEYDQVAVRETQYDDFLAERLNEEVFYQVKFNRMVDEELHLESNGTKIAGLMDYDKAYMAVANFRDTNFSPYDKMNDYDLMVNNQDVIGYTFLTPYMELAWLSKWAILGKQHLGPYRFSNTDIPVSEGLDVTLRHSELRKTYTFKGLYSINPKLLDYHTELVPRGRNSRNLRWGDNNSSVPAYSSTKYPVTNGYVLSTTLHKDMVSAYVSDVKGILRMNKEIEGKNIWVKTVLDACWNDIRTIYGLAKNKYSDDYLHKNYWSQYDYFVQTKISPNFYNTTTSLKSDDEKTLKLTDYDGISRTYTYQLPYYSMPNYHFAANMGGKVPTGRGGYIYDTYYFNWNGHAQYTGTGQNRLHHTQQGRMSLTLNKLTDNGKPNVYSDQKYDRYSFFYKHLPSVDYEIYVMNRWRIDKGRAVNEDKDKRVKVSNVYFHKYIDEITK